MSKTKKNIKHILDNNPNTIYDYINRKLKNPILRKSNKIIITKNIPYILQNTNEENYEWLNIDNLFFNKRTSKVFLKNIDNLNPNQNNYFIYNKIFETLTIFKENISQKTLQDFAIKQSKLNIVSNMFQIERTFNMCKIDDSDTKKDMLHNYLNAEYSCIAAIEYILYFCDSLEYNKLLLDSFDVVLNNFLSLDLYYIKKKLLLDKKLDPTIKEVLIHKIDDKTNEESEHYLKLTTNNLYKRFLNSNEEKNINSDKINQKHHEIAKLIYMLIKELAEYEKVPLSEVTELGKGAYSTVLMINNKVLKIGRYRRTKTFPNNPFINAMILRKEFKIDDNISIFIEISDKLDTSTKIEEEELYDLYKKLRDIGIKWTDISTTNVGRLTKENKVSWKEELPLSDEVLGLSPYINSDTPPQIGDIIILDNDFIFSENDKNIFIGKTKYYYKFRERYEEEHSNTKILTKKLNN